MVTRHAGRDWHPSCSCRDFKLQGSNSIRNQLDTCLKGTSGSATQVTAAYRLVEAGFVWVTGQLRCEVWFTAHDYKNSLDKEVGPKVICRERTLH